LTPERWARIRQIFEGALERPERDRAAYLRVVCAGDDPLRAEVESLLSSHHGAADFLDKPAADLGRALLSSGTLRTLGYRPGGESSEYQAGLRVGPYQLQKCLGSGGMGSVWLANRFDHEFDRKVAIKLVRRGMDSQEILRRFRLERQVLAGLDHTNIARLVDGGSTPDGMPYLVMEYVEGIRIDHYCEGRYLSISDRLRLFRQVCAAVQYAHQSLVVHRDIKASNILVTPDGSPKLLDFGIAKLLRTEHSTLAAAETRPELRPMTVDYASPEQVRGDPITVASDVYSLGVLLYKLLTGRFPYAADSRNVAAVQHAICNTEPVKPSAVILTDTQSAIPQPTQKIEVSSETRPKARQRLRKKLAGDLDSIILKALRKEPQARYASVEQLSQDIGRYLDGRPVRARGGAFGYRIGKYLRRNLPAVLAAAVLFAAFVVGLFGLQKSAGEAERRRSRAEAQFNALENVATRQHSELMSAYFRLAATQASLGDGAAALASYRAALEAARTFTRAHPGGPQGYLSTAQAAVRVGDLAAGEAADRYREALSQYDTLAARSYAFRPADYREQIAIGRRLGLAQFRARDYLGALAAFSRSLQIAEGLAARFPDDASAQQAVAAGNFSVAEVLTHNGAADAAIGKFRRAFELYRALAGVQVAPSRVSATGYEQALAKLAAAAPPELAKSIQADLAAFGR
jgi:serine/threonine protein kinase